MGPSQNDILRPFTSNQPCLRCMHFAPSISRPERGITTWFDDHFFLLSGDHRVAYFIIFDDDWRITTAAGSFPMMYLRPLTAATQGMSDSLSLWPTDNCLAPDTPAHVAPEPARLCIEICRGAALTGCFGTGYSRSGAPVYTQLKTPADNNHRRRRATTAYGANDELMRHDISFFSLLYGFPRLGFPRCWVTS